MKKHLSIFLASMIFLGGLIPSYSQSKDNITVNVDGQKMDIVGHPAVLDSKTGRVLIPFKSLFLALGVPASEIKWDAKTSTAIGNKEGTVVQLTKNNINAKVNGIDVKMDNAPIIMGNSMMVPLSFVAKHMGGLTSWMGSPDYIVDINIGNGLFPIDVPTIPSTPTQTTIPNQQNQIKAPTKDVGTKNSDVWGTYAMMNKNKDVIVVQFKSDKTLDIKNSTTGKTETATYSISGNTVVIKSNLIGGTYTLSSTKYLDKTYFVLKNDNNTLAMTYISYEQFASVY